MPVVRDGCETQGGSELQSVQLRTKDGFVSSPWRVPASWTVEKELGSGSYGAVASCSSGSKAFAVKKVSEALEHPVVALRTLREIRLLGHFNHPNILGILGVHLEGQSFEDVYVCLELCACDLNQLIHGSGRRLTDYETQSITYQILRGLMCLHSARVVHRDLKPGNVLLTNEGLVKLADLGLARAIGENDATQEDAEPLTEYVVTRWYRAPEVTLTCGQYTYAVDIWAAGCMLAEMVTRRRLFQGRDALDQIRVIVEVLGTPQKTDLAWVPSSGRKFIERCSSSANGEPFAKLLKLPGQNPLAMNLLARMLQFNPVKRILVEKALRHRYLEAVHSAKIEDDTPALAEPVDWSFDTDLCYDAQGQIKPFCRATFRRAFQQESLFWEARRGSVCGKKTVSPSSSTSLLAAKHPFSSSRLRAWKSSRTPERSLSRVAAEAPTAVSIAAGA